MSFQNFNTALADAFWFYAETQKPKIFWTNKSVLGGNEIWWSLDLSVNHISQQCYCNTVDNMDMAPQCATKVFAPLVLLYEFWFRIQQKAADVLTWEECGWFVCCLVVKNLCKASTKVAAKTSWDLEADWPDERRPVETNQTEREPSWLRTLQHAREDRWKSTIQFRGQLTHHARCFFA